MSVSPNYGLYKATVANNADPLSLTRVTVLIPQVLGAAESAWAVPSSPTNRVPPVGQVLWVQFSGGDVTRPVYAPLGLLKIDASQILAGSITADLLSATAIDGKIITGAVFRGTNYETNSSGTFVYSGTPAHGNLIASIAPVPGVDAYGNFYGAGLVSYDEATNFTFSQLLAGALTLGNLGGAGEPDTANAGKLVAALTGIPNSVTLRSPTNVVITDPVQLTVVSGHPLTGTGQPGTPYVELLDAVAASPADLHISGNLIKTNVAGSTETWHAPAYATNWGSSTTFAGVTGYTALQLRLDTEDNVWLYGCFAAGATLPGNTIFTLPPGFHPVTGRGTVSVTQRSGANTTRGTLQVNSDGTVLAVPTLGVTVAANDTFIVNGKVPLGNIA